jgi:hypothetical protein
MRLINKAIVLILLASCSVAQSSILLYDRTQFAGNVPFDNSTNGFVANNAQSAIEEVKQANENIARFLAIAGFDGTASTGRWLEMTKSVPSNGTPFVFPKNGYLTEFSYACAASATVTFGVYINAVKVINLVMTASQTGRTVQQITVNQLDQMSWKVESGSCSRPIVATFARFR